MRTIAVAACALLATVSACSATSDSEDASTESAVVIRRCPDAVSVSFSGFKAFSMDYLVEESGWDEESLDAPVARLNGMRKYDAKLALRETAAGQCFYAGKDAAAKDVTAKFWTRSGRNVFRVDPDSPSRDEELAFYIDVKADYSKTSIQAEPGDSRVFWRHSDVESEGVGPTRIGSAESATIAISPAE